MLIEREREITKLPFAHLTWAREHIAVPTLPSFSPYNFLYKVKILQKNNRKIEVNNQSKLSSIQDIC